MTDPAVPAAADAASPAADWLGEAFAQAEQMLAQLPEWARPDPARPPAPLSDLDGIGQLVEDWARYGVPGLTRLAALAVPLLHGLARAAHQQGRKAAVEAIARDLEGAEPDLAFSSVGEVVIHPGDYLRTARAAEIARQHATPGAETSQ